MDYATLLEGIKVDADIEKLQITDRQGAQADEITLEILNSDIENIERGRTLEGNFGGFKSGKMHVDKIHSNTTRTRIGAISTPVSAKEKRTRHWRKVRLFDIVNDVATDIGISVFYQDVENIFYENVTQYNETDLAFLNRLLTREGYALKIDDERAVIYDKIAVESAASVLTIKNGGDGILNERIAFSENPNMVQAVTVKHFGARLISYTATKGAMGARLTVKEYVGDEAEAERFAKGYLKYFTENDVTVDALIPINDGIASGNCVEFEGYARYDGKYFISECCHDPKNKQTRILGRRV